MADAFFAPFHLFTGPSKMMRITIPEGHRLVLFSIGHQPHVVPSYVMPMGDYEMAPEPLPGGSYPLAIQVLPASQAALVEKISVAMSDEIMRKAAEQASA